MKINTKYLKSKIIKDKFSYFFRTNKHFLYLLLLFLSFGFLIYLIYKDKKLSFLRDTFIFIKSNPVLFIFGFLLGLFAIMFFINWGKAGLGWVLKKVSFIFVLILALILFLYRDSVKLSEVQKARIRAEYQQDLDSTKKALSQEYRLAEKKLKAEHNDAESNINSLKESFDSLILVNRALQSRQSSATTVQQDCPDVDSLMSINEEMKDKIAVLEKTKPVKASVKSRGDKLKVSYKEPSISYCPNKHY